MSPFEWRKRIVSFTPVQNCCPPKGTDSAKDTASGFTPVQKHWPPKAACCYDEWDIALHLCKNSAFQRNSISSVASASRFTPVQNHCPPTNEHLLVFVYRSFTPVQDYYPPKVLSFAKHTIGSFTPVQNCCPPKDDLLSDCVLFVLHLCKIAALQRLKLHCWQCTFASPEPTGSGTNELPYAALAYAWQVTLPILFFYWNIWFEPPKFYIHAKSLPSEGI